MITCEVCGWLNGDHSMSCAKMKQAPIPLMPRPQRVIVDYAPDESLIRFLENQLEQARAGKLRAIAIAIVNRDDVKLDGAVDHGWFLSGSLNWALDRAIHRLRYFWDKHTHES